MPLPARPVGHGHDAPRNADPSTTSARVPDTMRYDPPSDFPIRSGKASAATSPTRPSAPAPADGTACAEPRIPVPGPGLTRGPLSWPGGPENSAATDRSRRTSAAHRPA